MEEKQPERYEISLEEIEKLRLEAKRSMSGHSWRQRGTEVYCESCPFHHAFYLPPGNILTGIDDDGNPIVSKIGGVDFN